MASTKRYLGRSELRIQLNDLLAEEYRRLVHRLADPDFALNGPSTVEDYGRRVMRYEAATEPLARMFGIIGRWGDEAGHRLAVDILSDLAQTKIEGGLNYWLDLRVYPAVLLLYAYGLGALKAGRHEILFRWLTQALRTEGRETKPAVARLLLGAWGGGENGRWQQLPGLERHKTPLSDHLHDVTMPWTADYTFAEREHTLLFEMFEVLGALAFLTLDSTKEQFEQIHGQNPGTPNFVWSPVGRAAWHTETRSAILSDLEQPELREALLRAGFGQGDEDHLKLAVESMRRLMGHIEWRF